MSVEQFTFDSPTSAQLEQARTLTGRRQLVEAERLYRQILEADPQQIEALRFLANAALSRNEPGDAIALLARAAAIDRSDIGVMLDLGVAYRNADRRDEARHVFRHALDLSQGKNTTARLMLAHVFEVDDRPEMALLHYFRAILDAQTQGRWLSDASTEPGLHNMVRHAMDFVARGRRALFDEVLSPFRQQAGAIPRIDAALNRYLREASDLPDDPRQRPTFLYLPGLGTSCALESTSIAGLDVFSSGVGDFDEGINACFAEEQTPAPSPFSLAALEPELDPSRSNQPRRIAACHRGNPTAMARQHLRLLLAALEPLPLMRIPGYGESISLLEIGPGTRLTPEYGRSNAICAALVSCANSAPVTITIGGESHTLEAEHALVADQSFGIGLENGTRTNARVLLMDVWHPALSQVERDAFTALTVAVLAFDARLQDPDQAIV